MKRRTFFASLVPATLAASLPAAPPARPRLFVAVLTPTCDDCNEGSWSGSGPSIRAAMGDLRSNIELATCEFDECYVETFEESIKELEAGATVATHWDMSCPEEGYRVELFVS